MALDQHMVEPGRWVIEGWAVRHVGTLWWAEGPDGEFGRETLRDVRAEIAARLDAPPRKVG